MVGLPVVVAALVLLYTVLSVWAYSFKDQTRDADAAIVLGAAVYTRTPSPVFAERINHGIHLYQDGRVKKLIFTGGKDPYDKSSEANAARTMAIKAGVPSDDILVENKSTNTWGNLVNSRTIMKEHGIKKVLIVSDPLHMKRSMAMARHLKLKAFTSPTPTSRYQSVRSQAEFMGQETVYYLSYILHRATGMTLPS